MKNGYAFLLIVAVVLLTRRHMMAQSTALLAHEAVTNGWLFSLREAKARARQSGKPLMVVIRCVP